MVAEKILRNTGLLAASGLMALALAALPVAPGLDAGLLDLKSAQAKGNGNGGGNGNGNGNGGGNGHGGGTASAGANSQGNGHGKGVSAEGHGLGAEGHGLTASAMKGLNAVHASKQGFANANIDSMVGQIGLAVQNSATGVDNDDDELVDTDDIVEFDQELNNPTTFAQALADILGVEDPEANPVSDAVRDEVKDLADDKVAVP